MSKRFNEEENRIIRENWPNLRHLARILGRTVNAIRRRATKLGLPSASGQRRRLFSDADREMIRSRYRTEGAKPLAREMGRDRNCIVALAQRMGVVCIRRWTEAEDRRLMQLLQAGKKHAEIVVQMGRSYSAIAKRAQEVGMARRLFSPAARRQSLITIISPRPLGSEARWARERIALGEHGWPPDMNPKEVRILESLRKCGPQSRRALALSIGEPATRDPRKFLMTHGGCSAMARVMARGLVARMRINRDRKVVYVYTLTTAAMKQFGTFGSVRAFNARAAGTRRVA